MADIDQKPVHEVRPTTQAMLAELNTRPRTTYLGVVRNPNPEIKG
jgi:hypothetical protein